MKGLFTLEAMVLSHYTEIKWGESDLGVQEQRRGSLLSTRDYFSEVSDQGRRGAHFLGDSFRLRSCGAFFEVEQSAAAFRVACFCEFHQEKSKVHLVPPVGEESAFDQIILALD